MLPLRFRVSVSGIQSPQVPCPGFVSLTCNLYTNLNERLLPVEPRARERRFAKQKIRYRYRLVAKSQDLCEQPLAVRLRIRKNWLREIQRVKKNQAMLGESIRTFGSMGKNVDSLRIRYSGVTEELNRLTKAQEKLNRVEELRQKTASVKSTAGSVLGGSPPFHRDFRGLRLRRVAFRLVRPA